MFIFPKKKPKVLEWAEKRSQGKLKGRMNFMLGNK